jgi:hypothetical protein
MMYNLYIFVLLVSSTFVVATAFSPRAFVGSRPKLFMSAHHPFCDLPGDPSLILTTNIDLGDKKIEIMKGQLYSVGAVHILLGHKNSLR